MSIKPDKRDRAQTFRDRLVSAMRTANMTQTSLARAIHVDRSTLSQALTSDGPRLPGAHIIASAAETLGVSTDWLLNLSDRPESAQDLIASSLGMTGADRALVDEQIFAWHQEAQGYKIRHVPAALPDMLKTEAMLHWEYEPHLGRSVDQAIAATALRLDWMRSAQSDYEIALPLHELTNFIHSTGYYADLPPDIRDAQIQHFITLSDQLYPRLRIYLFDARHLFASPLTVFGPLLAVLYTGGHYLTFRDRDRIETLSQHFDHLIRHAEFTARDIPEYLTQQSTR